jgi:sugar phosphate permease
VFLITQYFQFLKDYAPLSTGVRILPVALSIGIGSMLGVRLSVSAGNKAVVAVGLTMVGASFAWVSTASTATSYLEIAGQMVLAGIGLGFTTAPATEAIMGVVPLEKAGVGSAVNDATRELGGTLGVAVIGSVYASLYHSGLDSRDLVATGATRAVAKESIGAAIATARQLGAGGMQLLATAQRSFFDGFQAGCLVAAGVLIAGAIFAAIFLPSRPTLDGHPSIEPITQHTKENQ